ncbi:MAG: ATP-binding protein [Fusobacterium perfoetens]|uniref:sensor histidine kinase n=1 Tax=Fusobacterium perfoetens TaxID=852 RepID=UPI0023F3192C|nr:ATP-binding protein [Fusobacterium perfoetens]MCI6152162.1 ATP-binding protein [Fusobacterium perfoetens]MDY3237947.1 ATP-binding protein [Fusobacterium perfoetens]
MDNHLNRQEVISALAGDEGFHIRKSKTLGEYYAYYAVKYGKEDKYIIRTSTNYSDKRDQLIYFATILTTFFIVLNCIIHFFYINYLKRDFENKIKKMKRYLEKGNTEKLLYYKKEEKWIFEFWEVLKEWQKRNLDNIEKLDYEKKLLKLIITSVDSFVGLIDQNGEFVLRNNSLNHLLILDNKKYTKAFKYIEIIAVIKKSIQEKKDIRQEIYINGIKEYFIISVKSIKKNNQFLITIKDITSIRRTVEIQKTFISNVGHELKTPLTNIKGYLIALEDAPKEIRKKFLDIVKNNVIKLENTIIDFLNISKIESSKILQIMPEEIYKIEKQVNDSVAIIKKEKNAEIEFHWDLLSINQGFINTDKEKLILILKNLVENGIIYNHSDNPKIDIFILEEKDKYKFKIKDNGIGIPEDKLKKVFERFYRVDKARTSNLGGTGLGLSIVKEVVDQFGGEIKVESKEQGGSIFKFYLMK